MNITINIKNEDKSSDMRNDINEALRIIWENHYDGSSATFDSDAIQAIHDILYKHSN